MNSFIFYLLIDFLTFLSGADPGFFSAGAQKNAENQGHSSIELEMSKQYIDELWAKARLKFWS